MIKTLWNLWEGTNMPINSTTETSATTPTTPTPTSKKTTTKGEDVTSSMLGKDDFLKLFMESLKNQDPFSPMESADMMQQLSQLGQMESIANLKSTVDSMKESLLGNQIEQGASFIGRDVKALDSEGKLVEGEVDKVTVNDDVISLLINNKSITIGQIMEISA